ncbi:hypothetical protein KCU74_g86, partial [Aureobasidium melanogenum]
MAPSVTTFVPARSQRPRSPARRITDCQPKFLGSWTCQRHGFYSTSTVIIIQCGTVGILPPLLVRSFRHVMIVILAHHLPALVQET